MKKELFVIQRHEDERVLPGTYLTKHDAVQHMKALANGFTYSIDTITIPNGAVMREFRAQVEAKLRGAA